MRRSLKAIVLAASLAVTAQVAGAQALPQPPAGCTVQAVNGAASWVCALTTFATPAPRSTVAAATSAPTVTPSPARVVQAPVVNDALSVQQGVSFNRNSQQSFGFVQSLTVTMGSQTLTLSPDIRVTVPTTGASGTQNVVAVAEDVKGNAIAFDVSQANRLKLKAAQAAGKVSTGSLSYVLYAYSPITSVWTATTHTLSLSASTKLAVSDFPNSAVQNPVLFKIEIQ